MSFYVESQSIRADGSLTEHRFWCAPSGKRLTFDTWREAADHAESVDRDLDRWLSGQIRIKELGQ